MSREQSDSLTDEPSMLWRESLLSALAFQLRSADELLVLIEQGSRPESDYDKVDVLSRVIDSYQRCHQSEQCNKQDWVGCHV